MTYMKKDDIKLAVHNVKQTVEGLRTRRKRLRGKLNMLRAQAEQAEKSMLRVDEQLDDARAILRGMRAAYEQSKAEARYRV